MTQCKQQYKCFGSLISYFRVLLQIVLSNNVMILKLLFIYFCKTSTLGHFALQDALLSVSTFYVMFLSKKNYSKQGKYSAPVMIKREMPNLGIHNFPPCSTQ